MNNETEKAMWSCKTSDTPWTFSSLLKKAVCAVLSNAGSDSTCNEKNKNDIELVKIQSYGDSEGWIESKGGPINIVNSYDRY